MRQRNDLKSLRFSKWSQPELRQRNIRYICPETVAMFTEQPAISVSFIEITDSACTKLLQLNSAWRLQRHVHL